MLMRRYVFPHHHYRFHRDSLPDNFGFFAFAMGKGLPLVACTFIRGGFPSRLGRCRLFGFEQDAGCFQLSGLRHGLRSAVQVVSLILLGPYS